MKITATTKVFRAINLNKQLLRLWHSVWLFPVAIFIPVLILTALRINGSSIGVYHSILYGDKKDPDLLFNKPRSIRSDEWLIVTQMSIAQEKIDYARINPNIGNGEDVSLMIDVPNKDWTTLFKPHNLGFFVLPFDNAFAFRWWSMAYLLIVACYFFILRFLPNKRLFAAGLSIAFLFSPFIQWWYIYGTLGCLYYTIFAALVFMKLVDEKRSRRLVALGVLLAYLLVSFTLILYPPFQIPCLLVLIVFSSGYLLDKRSTLSGGQWLRIISGLSIAAVLSLIVCFCFYTTRQNVIKAVTSTAYPGQRIVSSGGYDAYHLLSSHLSTQFQYSLKASKYALSERGITNQSEASNFLLITPFLLLPSVALLVKRYKTKRVMDWALLTTSALFALLVARLTLPYFNTFFSFVMLDKVPHNRLLIGLGLLGFIHLVVFIRRLNDVEEFKFIWWKALVYSFAVFLIQLWLALHAKNNFPGFIGTPKAILLSLPIAIVVYLLLVKRFKLACLVLLLFSGYSSAGVNPIYRGTSIVSKSSVLQAIEKTNHSERGVWAAEGIYIEHFVPMSGGQSISGVYTYPQLDIWKPINGASESDYNRYAHVNFEFDRDKSILTPTRLNLVGADSFHVLTEPCSDYLKISHVRYLLTQVPLNQADTCASLVQQISYPSQSYYIYRIQY